MRQLTILHLASETQAVYFCSGDLSPPEFNHYGLAAPLYTHFTSPIRRYAGTKILFSFFVNLCGDLT